MSLSRLLASLRRYATPSGAVLVLRSLRDRRTISRSPFFDRVWYLRENPGVATAGTDPALHYLVIGHRAGLDPSAAFCGREYAALHGLPPSVNPLVHYERTGRRRGLAIGFEKATAEASSAATRVRIREKLRAGKALESVFLVTSASMFPARPLFDAMRASHLFRPRIAVVPDMRWPDTDPIPAMERCEAELARTVPADALIRLRPDGKGAWPDVCDGTDFTIYPAPYDISDFRYNPRWSVGRPFRAVHVNYGFYRSLYDRDLMARQAYAYFDTVFFECAETLEEYRTYSILRGSNARITGYVKMDALARHSPPPTARKTVLICPHHSVEGGLNDELALSNFLRHAAFFLTLPERHPALDFILRPHPFLFRALTQSTFWGPDKAIAWKKTWLAHPNAFWSDEGDYFPVFARSDACIQDCGSYLVEYFYTGKPQCYLLKDPSDIERKFAPLGRECLDHCRIAYDAAGIERFLADVVEGGHDDHAADREAFRRRIMVNYPHAAEVALEVLLEDVQ